MMGKRRLGRLAVRGTAVASAALVLAGWGSASTGPATAKPAPPVTHMVRIKGGTLTVAEAAADGPNYIFPMMGEAYFFPANLQLTYLLYRPLYWFGVGNGPALNEGLSLGELPVYTDHGRTVTIKMKGYKWSNGESVSARDVVFWMNMLKANATSWGGYVPGTDQFPGDVSNVSADVKTDTVTFSLDASYGSYWFTYNELSQVTPLPIAWDITSAGAKSGAVTAPRLKEKPSRFRAALRRSALRSDTSAFVAVFKVPPPKPYARAATASASKLASEGINASATVISANAAASMGLAPTLSRRGPTRTVAARIPISGSEPRLPARMSLTRSVGRSEPINSRITPKTNMHALTAARRMLR